MKILEIANTVGVIYKFRFELIKKMVEKGHEVLLVAQNENDDLAELLTLKVKYKEVKMSRRGINIIKDLNVIRQYYKIIKKFNPDKTLTYTIKANIYGGIVARLTKNKHIATVTGAGASFQENNWLQKTVVLLNKFALKKTETVFFQNLENRKTYLDFNIIKKENAVMVNGSGVNLKKFYFQEKTIKEDHPAILFIARIMKTKGIEEYLEMAKIIIEKGYKVEFQLLGSYEEKQWKEKVENYEKKGYVKYLGVSNDVRKQIINCDIVINPSYYEGMSNVLLEAGAMGKLLLGSNIGGIKEIIGPAYKGLLFERQNVSDMVEKIEKVLREKDKVKIKQIEKQMAFIKDNFSRDLVVEEYIKVIEMN